MCRRCPELDGGRFHLCHKCLIQAHAVGAEKRRATRLQKIDAGTWHARTPEQRRWRHEISRITKVAVELGLLPKLDGTIRCFDCNCRPAVCYDHRDYSQPLLVCPVCINCNSSRHKGEMPKPQTFLNVARQEAA